MKRPFKRIERQFEIYMLIGDILDDATAMRIIRKINRQLIREGMRGCRLVELRNQTHMISTDMIERYYTETAKYTGFKVSRFDIDALEVSWHNLSLGTKSGCDDCHYINF